MSLHSAVLAEYAVSICEISSFHSTPHHLHSSILQQIFCKVNNNNLTSKRGQILHEAQTVWHDMQSAQTTDQKVAGSKLD
jgi:hypothetical protein